MHFNGFHKDRLLALFITRQHFSGQNVVHVTMIDEMTGIC
jgi:hypothetical protein